MASIWSEILETQGAEVVASYQRGEFAGKPAITRNRFGEGQVIYIGVFSDERFYERIAFWLISEARISPPLTSSPGIEITERWLGDHRLLFLINHNIQPRPIRLNQAHIDLITSKHLSGTVYLGARDVMILKLPSGDK